MAKQGNLPEQQNQTRRSGCPTVELLVPVYHPGEELARMLNRMAKQTYPVSRVHLLITASQDDYQGLVKRYRRIWERAILSRRSVSSEDPEMEKTVDAEASACGGKADIVFTRIEPDAFDHGGTRHLGAGQSQAELLLFMTQDALPEDDRLVESLVGQFCLEARSGRHENALGHMEISENHDGGKNGEHAGEHNGEKNGEHTGEHNGEKKAGQLDCWRDGQGLIAAAYARQLPNETCHAIERYTRRFNYPEETAVKTKAELPRLGIKTYFCSNVCAMYRRDVYEQLGGFIRHTIFNEDMIYAAGVIQAGYGIAYVPEARVIHSHNYSAMQQLHRNFDLAVSQADHPEIFRGVPSEGEGIRMVKQTAGHLCRTGRWYLLPKLVWQSGWKYMGYLLGKHYRRLPGWMVRKLTMNPRYWRADGESAE